MVYWGIQSHPYNSLKKDYWVKYVVPLGEELLDEPLTQTTVPTRDQNESWGLFDVERLVDIDRD